MTATATATPISPDSARRDRAEGDVPGPAASRREVTYASLLEVLEDLESLLDRPVASAGAWTPAQNIEHVRRLIAISRGAEDLRMPLPIRLLRPVLGRFLKGWMLGSRMRGGFRTVDPLVPPADLTLDDALGAFRGEVALASRAGAMSAASPFLGAMTHEEWERLHCRHAELHFGNIVPAPGPRREDGS